VTDEVGTIIEADVRDDHQIPIENCGRCSRSAPRGRAESGAVNAC
jgi:hypothetical protein